MVLIVKLLTFISVNDSMILIAGGWDGSNFASVEVISKDARDNIQLPNLPRPIPGSPSMVNHNGTFLLCGGYQHEQSCLQMEENGWNHHSNLNKERGSASAVVATTNATFIFGGDESKHTYEYLDHGCSNWLEGNERISGRGFYAGCAIAISDEEIWLIGGTNTESRVLSFNTRKHEFKEVNTIQLNKGRRRHRCIHIPGSTKIVVSGGTNGSYNRLDSVEIIDFETKSVTNTGKMNFKRRLHGIGILTLDGEDQVMAVFGGQDENYDKLDSVEVYDQETQKWKMTDIKLSHARTSFGFLTVKRNDIPGL